MSTMRIAFCGCCFVPFPVHPSVENWDASNEIAATSRSHCLRCSTLRYLSTKRYERNVA